MSLKEHRYWIGTQPDPDDRLQIVVSESDHARISSVLKIDAPATVFDLLSEKNVTVQRADCGLGCRCALELVPEEF